MNKTSFKVVILNTQAIQAKLQFGEIKTFVSL